MISYFEWDEYYPITYEIKDGRLLATAYTYNGDGEEYLLSVFVPLTREGFRTVSQALRVWLRGRQVIIGNESYILEDKEAVLSCPLSD